MSSKKIELIFIIKSAIRTKAIMGRKSFYLGSCETHYNCQCGWSKKALDEEAMERFLKIHRKVCKVCPKKTNSADFGFINTDLLTGQILKNPKLSNSKL